MISVRYVGTVVHSSSATYSRNITDLITYETGSAMMLYSATRDVGGVAGYQITSADSLIGQVNGRGYRSFLGYLSEPDLDIIRLGDIPYIVTTGLDGSTRWGMKLNPNGQINSSSQIFSTKDMPADIVTAEGFSIGSQDYLIAARDATMGYQLYRLDDGRPVLLGKSAFDVPTPNRAAGINEVEVFQAYGKTFVISLSSMADMIAIDRVDAAGNLTQIAMMGPDNTLGINAPRDMSMIKVGGAHFLLVTGAQSNSLSVIEVTSTGQLRPVDHILDELTTRFDAGTALETITLNGRSFVFVGGNDDGITVFTLDATGRLIHLSTLIDDDQTSMNNVTAISAMQVGNKIVLFVSSATEPGITQFSIDPGRIGQTTVATKGAYTGSAQDDVIVAGAATTRINGGAGDDILIARAGNITLTGGSGADRFLPNHASKHVIITDFTPGTDILDLSELGMVRSISQVNIVPTNFGAILTYRDIRIDLYTTTKTPLSKAFFTDAMFSIAHYVNDFNYPDLVTPIVPTPQPDAGTPSPPPVTTPAPGGEKPGTPTANPEPPTSLVPLTRILGGAGNDVIRADPGGSFIQTFSGNDRITGSAMADRIWGGHGDDIIFGGDGNDTIIGNAGNDRIRADNGDDTVLGHGGDDFLWGGNGNDRVRGNEGNDFINGQDGDDLLMGDHGNDTIVGGRGNDTMNGGQGNDRMFGDDGNDRLNGIAGNNFMSGGAGNDFLRGGLGKDTIDGGPGHDTIIAGGSRDILFGQDGDDLIFAGSGNDRVRGMDGSDTIHGQDGDDWINAGRDDDFIYGGAGNDTLIGLDGNDLIYGEDGNDRLAGETGDDTLFGGEGHDWLTGKLGNDVLYGEGGHDTLNGGSGNNYLDGGAGDDLIIGGDDTDTILGGAGNDTLNAYGGNDLVWGGDGDDLISGHDGHDVLDGENGDDTIDGGEGNDTITGGKGDDVITAGAGDDVINGGAGRDILQGGLGADVFAFTHLSHSTPTARDRITDFTRGQDKIDISALLPDLTWIGTQAFSGPQQMRIIRRSKDALVQIDSDGDGRVDFEVQIDGGQSIDGLDFLF